MAKVSSNIKLGVSDRIYAKCPYCNFSGDIIYFNTPVGVHRADKDYWISPKICVFCELPPIHKIYGQSLYLRTGGQKVSEIDLEKPGVRAIIKKEQLANNGYLPELNVLSLVDNHIYTFTNFEHGTVLFEIYNSKFVDVF
jgi:hypothetical protein